MSEEDKLAQSYSAAEFIAAGHQLDAAIRCGTDVAELAQSARQVGDAGYVQRVLRDRDAALDRQHRATEKFIVHVANAVTALRPKDLDVALVWCVFLAYRDGDENLTFDLVGVARTEAAARSLAADYSRAHCVVDVPTFFTGSRAEHETRGKGARYVLEAARVWP